MIVLHELQILKQEIDEMVRILQGLDVYQNYIIPEKKIAIEEEAITLLENSRVKMKELSDHRKLNPTDALYNVKITEPIKEKEPIENPPDPIVEEPLIKKN